MSTSHGAAVFDGDGYSDAWHEEAQARGLPNLRTTLDALPELISKDAMELFERYEVFNHRQMHSRYEIGLEHYALRIGVEARLTLEIGTTSVLPAAVRHQTEVAVNRGALRSAVFEPDLSILDAVSVPLGDLRMALAGLGTALAADAGDTRWRRRTMPATPWCRRWPRCGRPGTRSRPSSPMTCGRCRPTRRCCSSSDPARVGAYSLGTTGPGVRRSAGTPCARAAWRAVRDRGRRACARRALHSGWRRSGSPS